MSLLTDNWFTRTRRDAVARRTPTDDPTWHAGWLEAPIQRFGPKNRTAQRVTKVVVTIAFSVVLILIGQAFFALL